jgi:hypothetical protein
LEFNIGGKIHLDTKTKFSNEKHKQMITQSTALEEDHTQVFVSGRKIDHSHAISFDAFAQ